MRRYIALCLFLVITVTLPMGCKKEDPQIDPEPPADESIEEQPTFVEKEILLFYPDKDNNFLLHEFRKVTIREDAELQEIAELALTELIKGSSNEMMRSIIERNTKVLSFRLHGTTATVDLSEDFIKNDYNNRERLFQVFSLVNTLAELGLEDVFLLVEGTPVTDYYTALDYNLPFIRNDELIPSK